jgi:peptidoglycan/xylan/chitin deacetylase (PgdA/CDA1 family)
VSRLFPTSIKEGIQTSLSHIPRVMDRKRRVVVLCYHSVHPTSTFPSATTPELFEQHMRWLRQHCDVVPFTRIRAQAARRDRSRPVVAVTFDDGFADNYTHALPILLRLEVPTTFFVATGLVERVPEVIRARSWRGWREEGSSLTWPQIEEMRTLGMEIGGHSHMHRVLADLSDEEVLEDLATCKRIIEDRLGEPIVSFAYPKGRPRRDLTSRTVELARSVGFRHGGTVVLRDVRPSDWPMRVPRFPMARDSIHLLRGKVLGRLDVIGQMQERAPLRLLA